MWHSTDFPDRSSLRRALRAWRRALSRYEHITASRQLTQRLGQLPLLRRAQRVGIYWPMDGEIDVRGLHVPGQVFLPSLRAFPKHSMRFVKTSVKGSRAATAHRLARNRFGIPEPRQRGVPAQAIDVILLPLTGFDAMGNRLGMGGGFYDRALAFKQHGQRRPVLIGVAYEGQHVDALAAASWDVPLDALVTERRIRRFRALR